MDANKEGLKEKYIVMRVDPTKEVGRCFVLEYDKDPFAMAALRSYAEACIEEYPKLSEDLMKIVEERE